MKLNGQNIMFLQSNFISYLWNATKSMKLECLPSLEPFKVTGQFLGKLEQQVRHRRLYVSLFMVLALCHMQFSLR